MIVISRAKFQNKCLNARERVEWKMVLSLPLLSCESSVSVKENPDRKKMLSVLNYVPHVSLYPTCLRALRICMPSGLSFLRAFPFLRALHALHAFISYVPSLLSASNFWRALCTLTFIKCGTTHNQPQLTGTSKSEVQYGKNSLNKPKQLRTVLKNYF